MLVGLVLSLSTAGAEHLETPDLKAFVADHCHDCHSGDDPKGEFSLDDINSLAAEVWEEILDQIATGEMPPKKKSIVQPEAEKREAAITSILSSLKKAGRNPSLPGGPLLSPGPPRLICRYWR